jgi:glycosyltransferase involved in cell wall biosynthesis
MNKSKIIYFDVTDIVEYAKNNSRVSGIQRVQARAIGALAHKYGDLKIRCTFFNNKDGVVYEFGASEVFRGSEFDSTLLLYRLSLFDAGRMPAKQEVKKYLQPFGHRKIFRAYKKIGLYGIAIVNPRRLSEMGLKRFSVPVGVKKIKLTPLSGLGSTDVFVFLGSNWSFPEILQFGRDHFEGGGDVVQMIYDLIPHKTPEYCTNGLIGFFNDFLHRTPTYASRFMCISDWTKRDFVGFLEGINVQKEVVTVPLAHEFDGFARNESLTQPTDSSLTKYRGQKFVLCVGTIEIRKNGLALLEAWDQLISEIGDEAPQLIFAGKYGWKIHAFMERLESSDQLAKKVTILSAPSDVDLAFLYQNCYFSIYPSFYEGWGLPVGESAWFGRYVISSSTTSLPEVCGDLVDYVEPDNISDIKSKVLYAIKNPEYIKMKERRIKESALRTWDDVAESIMRFVDSA